jgi:hypothetical protein
LLCRLQHGYSSGGSWTDTPFSRPPPCPRSLLPLGP